MWCGLPVSHGDGVPHWLLNAVALLLEVWMTCKQISTLEKEKHFITMLKCKWTMKCVQPTCVFSAFFWWAMLYMQPEQQAPNPVSSQGSETQWLWMFVGREGTVESTIYQNVWLPWTGVTSTSPLSTSWLLIGLDKSSCQPINKDTALYTITVGKTGVTRQLSRWSASLPTFWHEL